MSERATPEMIAAAWKAWHSRHGGKLGPGPSFVEAINAALAAQPKPVVHLTTEMIEAVCRIAERYGTRTESVLNRMIFPYAAKMDRPAMKPDTSNVVALRRTE